MIHKSRDDIARLDLIRSGVGVGHGYISQVPGVFLAYKSICDWGEFSQTLMSIRPPELTELRQQGVRVGKCKVDEAWIDVIVRSKWVKTNSCS